MGGILRILKNYKMFFEIEKQDSDSRARLGCLNIFRGKVFTPQFVPSATGYPYNSIATRELKFWGAEAVLADSFSLWQRPGDSIVFAAGGVDKVLNWDKGIISSSAASDIYLSGSAAEKSICNLVVNEEGAIFQTKKGGVLFQLGPAQSAQIQSNLSSDIAQTFFYYDKSTDPTGRKKIIALNSDWAERAKRQFDKIVENSSNPQQKIFISIPFIEKADYNSFLDKIKGLNFDGHTIVYFSSQLSIKKFKVQLLSLVEKLDPNKPLILSGQIFPDYLVQAVAVGFDLIETTVPVKLVEQRQVLVAEKKQQGYKILDLNNDEYLTQAIPIDNTCDCYACLNNTRAGMVRLFNEDEATAIRFCVMHNLKFYFNLMDKIRRAVKYESFKELAESYKAR